MTNYAFETRQIHAAEHVDTDFGARITPIYQSAGYVFNSYQDAQARFAGTSDADIYSRSDNPTNRVVEGRLADLEGGIAAVLTSSGQAAIFSTLYSLASTGDRILATSSLYEGTKGLFRNSLARQGLEFDFLDQHADDETWRRHITPRTRALYTETIPNPKNDVADLARVARIAHEAGIPLVVDNTVATPYLNRPIEHGADIVIHSTSKWLAGHGAVIGGVVVDGGRFDWSASDRYPQFTDPIRPGGPSFVDLHGPAAFAQFLRKITVNDFGPTLPPTSAFLLLAGIETLSVRMDRHVDNALAIARWLDAHPGVIGVDYPGLEGDPYHELAATYLPRGAGSIVSFDVGSRERAERLLDSLQLVTQMTHIGDVRTLAIHTGSTIHGKLSEDERLAIGITPGLIRLSVGLEHVDDVISDLAQALEQAG